MSGSPLVIVAVTIAIIALSGFFVAVEFALLAVKRHRLEDAALRSRSARAALRNASELSLLLAGAQLGITVCTLALGAITKPAVHDWLMPAIMALGAPELTADIAAFVLALFIVTFLHLVIGEMAPKSWAIAHPETSATLLALPMRGFLIVTRPLLLGLNSAANWLLMRFGVTPVNAKSSAQDVDALRHLVQHSEESGTLDVSYSDRVATALAMQSTPVLTLVRPGAITQIPPTAQARDVQAATLATGHHRALVGDSQRLLGMVHVRETLTKPGDFPVADLIRPVLVLDAQLSIHEALANMRRSSTHLAVVRDDQGALGLITLDDVLSGLIARSSPG